MKKQNHIDQLVEKLASEFSQIKNFEMMQEDPMGKMIFDFVVKNAFELMAFKNLFVQSYLPAATKSQQEYLRELKFSKYKNLISVSQSELKENYYETIRLGYVGAYHKYESYIKSLPKLMDKFFSSLFEENEYEDMETYLKKKFNIELLKTINTFYMTEKVNWIANCVKHYDGFPVKEPILIWFKYADKTKRLQIEAKEFKEDIEHLAQQNQLMLNAIFLVGFHQYMNRDFEKIKDQLTEGKSKEDVEKSKNEVENLLIKTFKKPNIT